MREERPDKQYVRDFWTNVVEQAHDGWAGPEALYLTLSGAHGYDISLLAERGLIKRTESGAIDPADVAKIVAVERGRAAYTELRERFPGLRTINQPIESLTSGASDLTKFPNKRDRDAIRSRVINLDYNGSLIVNALDGGVDFPQLTFIQKIAYLHSSPMPAIDWTLLLTLNGQIDWEEAAHALVASYLCENIKLSAQFSSECEKYFAEAVYEKIVATKDMDFSQLSPEQQQTIVSVLVPKKIASLVSNTGWRTRTFANWRYGGGDEAASMCTWAIKFLWDRRSSYQPNQVYQDSLVTMFESFASISPTGKLVAV